MDAAIQKDSHKKLFAIVVAVCVLMILGFGLWLMWLFGTAEHFASCDGNYTIWRRNPGASSSYVYEIRDGVFPVETGLHTNQLTGFLNEHSCVVPGGG